MGGWLDPDWDDSTLHTQEEMVGGGDETEGVLEESKKRGIFFETWRQPLEKKEERRWCKK